MKLYSAKVDTISNELIKRLVEVGDIEVGSRKEAELDVSAVLKEYIRVDRELTERAKDILEIRGQSQSAFGRTKKMLAEEKDFGLGEDGFSWICNQLLETFMQSKHIEEVFSDDPTIRKRIKEVLRRHTGMDEQLDTEVRSRIKNLQEGTETWEVEYQRVMERMKNRQGVE